MLLQAFLPRMVADSSIMEHCGRTACRFSKMQALNLLTLLWHSFLGHSYDVVDSIFDEKAGR